MRELFISNERKKSMIRGTGIQYIPGHIEPFVDLILNNYLPEEKDHILDLGGGGLRFAIPVAALKRKITVVDLDSTGTEYDLIIQRIKEIGHVETPDVKLIRSFIHIENCNCFDYLERTTLRFSLITAFRLIHFFNEEEVVRFFKLVSRRLVTNGILAVSAFSANNTDDNSINDIYLNSEPVKNSHLYRKFLDNSIALEIRKSQNLGKYFHVFTGEYLKDMGEKVKLKIVKSELISTRIVKGYVFIKE